MNKGDIKIGTIFFNGYQSTLKQCHLITKVCGQYVFTIGLALWDAHWSLNCEERWYKEDLRRDVMKKVGEINLIDLLTPFALAKGEFNRKLQIKIHEKGELE